MNEGDDESVKNEDICEDAEPSTSKQTAKSKYGEDSEKLELIDFHVKKVSVSEQREILSAMPSVNRKRKFHKNCQFELRQESIVVDGKKYVFNALVSIHNDEDSESFHYFRKFVSYPYFSLLGCLRKNNR